MYIQNIVEPEGVREVFTRDTDSLKLELEGHGQVGSVHLSKGTLQAGNNCTTQQRPDMPEIKAWWFWQKDVLVELGYGKGRCRAVQKEAVPSVLDLGLGKTLHPVSKEAADQSSPWLSKSCSWLEAELTQKALRTPSAVPGTFITGTQNKS